MQPMQYKFVNDIIMRHNIYVVTGKALVCSAATPERDRAADAHLPAQNAYMYHTQTHTHTHTHTQREREGEREREREREARYAARSRYRELAA